MAPAKNEHDSRSTLPPLVAGLRQRAKLNHAHGMGRRQWTTLPKIEVHGCRDSEEKRKKKGRGKGDREKQRPGKGARSGLAVGLFQKVVGKKAGRGCFLLWGHFSGAKVKSGRNPQRGKHSTQDTALPTRIIGPSVTHSGWLPFRPHLDDVFRDGCLRCHPFLSGLPASERG